MFSIAPRNALVALCLSLALFTVACSGCSPSADVLNSPIVGKLEKGMDSGTQTYDHSAFDALLAKHVSDDGMVDYKALKSDRAALESYLRGLALVDLTSLSRDAQMALLINAYNGYTLQLILDNLDKGISSIKDISQPWDTAKYNVAGYTLSLNDIEHGLLRPLFLDPRVHFAVNCASIGCPKLLPKAYTAAELESMLEKASRGFAQDPKYVTVSGDSLRVSRILKWYGGDFTNPKYKGHEKNIPAYIRKYTTDNVQAFIDSKGGDPNVDFMSYDWNLNAK